MKKVLIIEKQLSARELLITLLHHNEFQVFSVEEGIKALDLLKKWSFDLIFSDLKGIQTLNKLRQRSCRTTLVHLSNVDDPSIDQVDHVFKRPFTRQGLDRILGCLKASPKEMVAESPQIKQIIERLEKIAQSHSNIFISGESGTGKEVIANMIHNLSKRYNYSFVRVNCAALPDTLIESEFFGHEKGAFTGAIQKRIGRFELAHQGTFLLDEVSEIPASLQAKLLRVVQEQEFERVGGTKSLSVDVRLISTSNCNMKVAIKEGKFREDLYYRLNVIPIHLPPLRERKEDIIPLAVYFLKEICSANQFSLKILTKEAEAKLLNYSWPGNIRELRNVIEYSVVMNYSDKIEENHLLIEPYKIQSSSDCYSNMTLKSLEKAHILRILQKCDNNRTHTAKELGITVRTLRNKLKLYQ